MAQKKNDVPPVSALLLVYSILGALFLYFFERPFDDVESIRKEFALPLGALAVFMLSYETCDCMTVGKLAMEFKHTFKNGDRFHTSPENLPASYVHALRAQTNQVEQVPFFCFMLMGAVLFANGAAVGALGVLYCTARIFYGRAYRSGVGALGVYTIPCYFIMGTLCGVNLIGAAKTILNY